MHDTAARAKRSAAVEARARPALIRQVERRVRQRVSTKTPRPQERQRRGTERVRKASRSSYPLPIVTQIGRDYRPGPRQRIERVAQRVAHHV